MMKTTTDQLTAPTLLRVVMLLGIALAIGPAFGLGLSTSLLITAVAALLAHERRVIGDWRAAPARLSTPR